MYRIIVTGLLVALLSACASTEPQASRAAPVTYDLHPNETPELRQSIDYWADHYDLPPELVHRLAIRESTHQPWARNGPYYGLLQILPATARSMGYQGPAKGLLDADTNLEYALKYLKGAYMVADGDPDRAIRLYAKGYYHEAKAAGLLDETGLR